MLEHSPSLLLYCRPGFEKECAAEIIQRAKELAVSGWVKASPDSAFVRFFPTPDARSGLETLKHRLRFGDLIFARQWVWIAAACHHLPQGDRIQPLLEAASQVVPRFSALLLETPDTNQGRGLSAFTRKFAPLLSQALVREKRLSHGADYPRLHLFFTETSAALIGTSDPGNSSRWPMGIPRLKFPAAAPSRSTLKLDEAFQLFVGNPERDLQPGMTAVDLGAAPGGWTYQLVRRHIRVTAVDNGQLHPSLMESGIVTHLQSDGFRFRPSKPVDWLVCDMVEQPSRITRLVAEWATHGWCQQALFNLKLPMKKRFEMVSDCLEQLSSCLKRAEIPFQMACKQLYHDRAEVTVHLRCLKKDS